MASTAPLLTWEEAYSRLAVWAAEHGHARVPQQHVDPDGFRLGKWVHNQRTAYRLRQRGEAGAPQRSMPEDRVRALEEIPGWTWNVRQAQPVHSAPRPGMLPTRVLDVASDPICVRRAVIRWLDARRAAGDHSPFSEEMLRQDAAFHSLLVEERVRVGLAAVVATGAAEARTGPEGDLLSWRVVLTAAEVDQAWTFRSTASRVDDTWVPAEVLTVYEQATDRVATVTVVGVKPDSAAPTPPPLD